MFLLLYTCNSNVETEVLTRFSLGQKCACWLEYKKVVGGSGNQAVERKQEREASKERPGFALFLTIAQPVFQVLNMCIIELVNFTSAPLEPSFVFFFFPPAITYLIPKENEKEREMEKYEKQAL